MESVLTATIVSSVTAVHRVQTVRPVTSVMAVMAALPVVAAMAVGQASAVVAAGLGAAGTSDHTMRHSDLGHRSIGSRAED